MIEYQRQPQNAPGFHIKVLGIGGAGANALDRLALDGMPGASLVAVNSDAQALAASVAPEKVQIGAGITRGLGTGGDPELGYRAAEDGVDELAAVLEGSGLVFLIAGLGGGMGSGATPLIANYAREQDALVVAFVTLPFSFEGRRRMEQAQQALEALQQQADVIVCFENDRLDDVASPRAGIGDTFAAADVILSQSVRAIASLVNQRGLVHIGFDELVTTLRAHNARCIFGIGEGEGENRAHVALERALRNPLMDRGRLLEDASNVLVNIVGGPSMTLNEVRILMEELTRHLSDDARVHFGCAVDPTMGGRMSVTLITSIGADIPAYIASAPASAPRIVPAPAPVREVPPQPVAVEPEPEPAAFRTEEEVVETPAEPVAAEMEPEPEPEPMLMPPVAIAPLAPAGMTSAAKKAAAPRPTREEKQEQMSFEPVTRGRFEKSEPTIVDGEDLDVPTFLRRNVKVK